MSKILCIYHGGCDDGFAAAWVIRATLGSHNVEFYPGVYQKEPPDVVARHVVLVDFSYKRPVLLRMAEHAKTILILDHHKTAAEDLAGFQEPAPYEAWHDTSLNLVQDSIPPIAAKFDMERCGATMAWDYFYGGERPDFFAYIEDRDLWRKVLPDGDAFTMALRSYPQDFEVWDRLVKDGPYQMIGEGKTILRYYRQRIEELKQHAYIARFPKATFGENLDIGPFAVCNAPYAFASEIAGELCDRDGALFGATFFEVEPGKFQYSLRSRGNIDVSEVAKSFGGGGHKDAAGFVTFGFAHTADNTSG